MGRGSCMFTWVLANHFPHLKNYPENWCVVRVSLACWYFQTEAERQRREAGVIQWLEKRAQSMFVCIFMHTNRYVCMFFGDFSRLRALAEPKVVPYMVGFWIIHCLSMFLAKWCSQRQRGSDRSSHRLNIMVRAMDKFHVVKYKV